MDDAWLFANLNNHQRERDFIFLSVQEKMGALLISFILFHYTEQVEPVLIVNENLPLYIRIRREFIDADGLRGTPLSI